MPAKTDNHEMNVLLGMVRKALFWAVFLLTPLLINPWTYDSFVLPKIIWIKGIVAFLVVVYLLLLLWGGQLRLVIAGQNLLLLVFLLYNAISVFWAGSPSLARESVAVLCWIYLFIFLWQDYVYGQRCRLVLLAWMMLWAGFLTSLWIIGEDVLARFFPQLQYVQPRLPDWRGALSAGLGNTSHLGDFLALCFLLGAIFYLLVRGKPREIFLLLLLWCTAAAMLLCWSVSSVVGLGLGIALTLFLLRRRLRRSFWQRKRFRLAVLCGGIILIILFYLVPHPLNPHHPSLLQEAFASERWHAGWPTRIAIWLNTLEMIRHHWLFGVGTGNFTYFFPQSNSLQLLGDPDLRIYAGSFTNAAHNELLQTWAELGLAGLLLFLLLIVHFYKRMLQDLDEQAPLNYIIRVASLGLMTSFLSHSLMNFPLRTPWGLLLFFCLLALPPVMDERRRNLKRFLFPVELSYPSVSVTILLENLRQLKFLSLQLKFSRVSRALLTACLLAAMPLWLFHIHGPLMSDYHYRQARELEKRHQLREAEREFKLALSLNPEHSDCRSAWSAFLLQQQRFREALSELQRLEERLRANEVYLRLGLAHHALGEEQKARSYLRRFFTLRPIEGLRQPALYRWAFTSSPPADTQ